MVCQKGPEYKQAQHKLTSIDDNKLTIKRRRPANRLSLIDGKSLSNVDYLPDYEPTDYDLFALLGHTTSEQGPSSFKM